MLTCSSAGVGPPPPTPAVWKPRMYSSSEAKRDSRAAMPVELSNLLPWMPSSSVSCLMTAPAPPPTALPDSPPRARSAAPVLVTKSSSTCTVRFASAIGESLYLRQQCLHDVRQLVEFRQHRRHVLALGQ